jgi:hypothetical protein
VLSCNADAATRVFVGCLLFRDKHVGMVVVVLVVVVFVIKKGCGVTYDDAIVKVLGLELAIKLLSETIEQEVLKF